MTILSPGRCQDKFNITPTCFLDPPFSNSSSHQQYTIVGQYNRNNPTFEGNPDIAGLGVLLAFFGVTALAVFVGSINVTIQFFSKILAPWILKRWDPKSLDKLKAAMRSGRQLQLDKIQEKLSKASHKFVIQCGDQQVVTGIVLSLSFLTEQACEISAYHYMTLVSSLLATCTTAALVIASVPRFFFGAGSKLATLARLLGIIALIILTGQVVYPLHAEASLPFPTKPGNDLLILPALCFIQTEEPEKEISTSWLQIYAAITAYTVIMGVFDAFLRLIRFIRDGPEDHTWSWRDSLMLLCKEDVIAFLVFGALGFLITFGFGTGVLIWLAVEVSRLRNWISSSVWMSGGSNAENDLFAIGQALPAVLFLLPLIAALGGTILPSIKFVWMFFFQRSQLLQEQASIHSNEYAMPSK